MNKCEELITDIVAIWPLPVGAVPYGIPLTARVAELKPADLGVNALSELLDGRPYYSMGEAYTDEQAVEITSDSPCEAESTPKQTAYGLAHDVTLKIITTDDTSAARTLRRQLMADRHDFVIQRGDGQRILVRTSPLAYDCSPQESIKSGVYTSTITVKAETVNGFQILNEG